MKNQIINFVAILMISVSMQSCIGPAHLGSERTFVDRPRAAGQEAITATAKYNNSGSYAGDPAENISGDLGITYSKNFKNNTFMQVGADVFVGKISNIDNSSHPNFPSEGGTYNGFSGRLEFGGNVVQTKKYRFGLAAISGGSIEGGALHGSSLGAQGNGEAGGSWFSQLLGAKADFTYMFNENAQVGVEAVIAQRLIFITPIGEYYHLTGFATVKKMTYFVQGSYSPVFSFRPIVSVGIGYKF
jgi:hypothetical protein